MKNSTEKKKSQNCGPRILLRKLYVQESKASFDASLRSLSQNRYNRTFLRVPLPLHSYESENLGVSRNQVQQVVHFVQPYKIKKVVRQQQISECVRGTA